jgi:hypothetical protein
MADEDVDNGSDAEVERAGRKLHGRFMELLLAEVERERYPSNQLLDLLEACMNRRDRIRIANVLMDELEAQRYPSPEMLRRVRGWPADPRGRPAASDLAGAAQFGCHRDRRPGSWVGGTIPS